MASWPSAPRRRRKQLLNAVPPGALNALDFVAFPTVAGPIINIRG
jgi:hypothetical protein